MIRLYRLLSGEAENRLQQDQLSSLWSAFLRAFSHRPVTSNPGVHVVSGTNLRSSVHMANFNSFILQVDFSVQSLVVK